MMMMMKMGDMGIEGLLLNYILIKIVIKMDRMMINKEVFRVLMLFHQMFKIWMMVLDRNMVRFKGYLRLKNWMRIVQIIHNFQGNYSRIWRMVKVGSE